MLEDIYQSYLDVAENIPDWRSQDKSDLIREYCKLHDEDSYKADYYMAAIMCKYWPKIQRFYFATPKVCTYEDVYDWLTEAIIKTLEYRTWLDPTHKLYGDPKAPDKCVNIRMKSIRLNYLIAVNRDKRKLNINNSSLEELQENIGDAVKLDTNFDIDLVQVNEFEFVDYKFLMQFFYDKKLYFLSFVYDFIVQSPTFSIKTCALHLTNLDDNYLYDLAKRTEIKYPDVLVAYSFSILGKSIPRLHSNINQALIKLRKMYNEGVI